VKRLQLDPFSVALFLAAIVVFAVLRQFLGAYEASNLSLVAIYFIAILGLNVVTGYSGQISLGHGAFLGVGAYTTAILVEKADFGVWWTIPFAGLVSGIAGFLFGLPALRLHGVYLALATFGLAVAFIQLAQSDRFERLTGGSQGLAFGLPSTPYYEAWGIAAGALVVAWLLLRGRLGRSFRAVRDAPLAAVSSGLNLALYKSFAFAISAAYAGVAGALLAIQLGSVNYLTFPVALSINLLVGAALAGLGGLNGAIFGALFLVYAPLQAEDLSKQAPAVMYGLLLLAVLFLAPGGAAQVLARLSSLLKRVTNALYSRPTQAEVLPPSTRSDT
jgi:branched-chain amino acid transport system permease protein